MRPPRVRCGLLCAMLAALPFALRAQNRPQPRQARPALAEPSLSPDRAEIAFVSGGDIWAVPVAGGAAHLLASHPATESRPLYSPDGTRLAFMSNRAGSMDIWLLTFATGDLHQLTFDDGNEQLDGWSRDGAWIYFSSTAHDVAGMTDVYRVRATGGTPMPISADRYAAEFMSAPSPDGAATALVARGFAQSQWWRAGHSHLDESELWLVRGDGSRAPSYERLLGRGAKQQWPMWSADGSTLFYVSDRDGAANLWTKPLRGGEARRLTSFTDGRVLWPSISADGRAIVFERDFGIWLYDLSAGGAARSVPITLRGASATAADQHLSLTTGFQELAVSPDGKKIAFVAHGEVFTARADSGGDALRVTRTPAAEAQLAWAPNSRHLAYASNRDGAWHLYLHDFATGDETQLTRGERSDANPRWSPDGLRLAFLRDARELRVLDVAARTDRVVANGVFGRPPFLSERPIAWSPDSRWIAFLAAGPKLMVNAFVVPVGGGDAQQVSWLSNTRASTIAWSPDGASLLLDSGMRTETGVVARIDVTPRTPRLREDLLAALFRDTTPGRTTPVAPVTTPPRDTGAPAPARETRRETRAVRVVVDGIRQRLALLPVGVDVGSASISPDGRQLLLVASAAGQQQLFTYPLDELTTEPLVSRQITTTAGFKSSAQWAPDSKSVWFLEQGRIVNVPVESRTPRQVAVRGEMDVDFAREKMEVFYQAWEFLNDNFYDPAFHGTNWNAVRERYAPLIAGARTPDEMRRLLNLMVGEMNASHMGISAPGGGTGQPGTGRLGLHFERAAYEQRGELRITEIIPLSPAALSERLRVGDVVLAVDGARVGAGFNLDSALNYKFDRRVTLTVAADAGGRDRRDVSLRATNGNTEKGLLYRQWVAERRAYVTRASGGRLGYVHMLDMGGGAIAQLNLDLDVESHAREGVVLDIRFNNGGFVNGYALDVLSRQPYVLMVRRGVPAVPGRPVLGQRALEAPTVLVTNQHTLSDGENFTEGYRTMKLGRVVGEPTAGWDVYTGSGTMVDGTSVRLPFMKNATLDGTAIELKPRAVDVAVDRPLGESFTGKDAQLDAAVRELLVDIDAKRGGKRPTTSGKE